MSERGEGREEGERRGKGIEERKGFGEREIRKKKRRQLKGR